MRNKIGFIILIFIIVSFVFAFVNFHIWDFIEQFLFPEKIVDFDNHPLNQEFLNEIRGQLESSRIWRALGKILTTIFTLTIIFTATIIILENRNPSKTLVWLLVLLFLPVIGFIFYILFGRSYRKRKLVKEKEIYNHHLRDLINQQMQIVSHEKSFDLPSKRRLINLILSNSNSPFTRNNNAKVLTNGKETFGEIIRELKKAKKHIHMEYYIIQDDEIGKEIQEILIKKALSGVEVRLIYDGVGSRKLSLRYIRELKNAGVEVRCFLPVVFPFLNSKINFRNHRKIIVIDGKIGFVGGLNIGDEYLGKNKRLGFWRDTHLKLMGDSVYFLQNIFIQDWYFAKGDKLNETEYFPAIGKCGDTMVQITSSGPDSDWEAILQAYFSIISTAEKKIYITTPYLIPDDSILMALKTAALSGVDVRIIVPGRPDKRLVFWASHSYFEELLEAGVKIYKYNKGFIHAKILLVDDSVASIGTANMDIRSFKLDFEVNALVYDEKIYKRLENDFFEDIKYSDEIEYGVFKERRISNKFKESGARLLSPLL